MGSFTEVVLAFMFRADTPPEVLGAFQAWRTPGDAPELPTLEDSVGRDVLDELLHLTIPAIDEPTFDALPLLHKAVAWNFWCSYGGTAYFPGEPGVHMRWHPHGGRWTLTIRNYPQEHSDDARMVYAPLGAFAAGVSEGAAELVGYLRFEYDTRPTLVWNTGAEEFIFQDLRNLALPEGVKAAGGP